MGEQKSNYQLKITKCEIYLIKEGKIKTFQKKNRWNNWFPVDMYYKKVVLKAEEKCHSQLILHIFIWMYVKKGEWVEFIQEMPIAHLKIRKCNSPC